MRIGKVDSWLMCQGKASSEMFFLTGCRGCLVFEFSVVNELGGA
ncbi:hypothetical protein RRSWK_04268 [Rhodopirellula sp. SWK7]|nr:hypothetical protein RRSWK_04268 [Rhodopirellula sp. SWK7]